MKTAYLDAFSGLSGDMIVGAILDCGADFGEFERAIKSMPLAGYRLSTRRKTLSGISALKFDVAVTEPQPERHFGEIRALIDASPLAATVRQRAIAIFEVLAQAEAKIHDTTPDHVHFHEVGAVDSIIDIVGTAWGFEQLGVDGVLVSPLPMGNGFARSQHGVIPVPAPATAELLSGFPLKIGDGAHEMVTPTGAAVIRALARPAAIPLAFEVEKIGYGAGSRELEDRPNVLRLMLGRERAALDSDEMIEIVREYRRPQPADLRPRDESAVRRGRARRDAHADDDEEGPPGGDAERYRRGRAPRRDRRDYFRRDLDHRSQVSFSRAAETAS